MTKQKLVLFFAPYGSWLIHNQVDAVVASSLKLRNCDVIVVGCDGLYGLECCVLEETPSEHRSELCRNCSQAGQVFFESTFHLPYLQLKKFITSGDRQVAEKWVSNLDPSDYLQAAYRGIPIGEWVASSIFTHFRISEAGLSRSDVREVHRKYLADGLITYHALLKILDRYRVTNMFLFNARMLPYRVAFEVAQSKQIDTLVHERGYLADSFSFFDNSICLSPCPPLKCVSNWKDIPLNNPELQETKAFFKDRETGKNTNWSFYDFQSSYTDIRSQLRIPSDRKIVSVFTSSEDEVAMSGDYQGITSQLDVIDRLIEIFAERDEYLVIRHHPYIGGQNIYMADTDFLSRAYQQALTAPKNVRIIMPSERITSYALLWNTDATIAFFSTVAIESVARGVPTASWSISRYSQAVSYLIDRVDRTSLQNLVDTLLSKKLNVNDFVKLYRFARSYFFKFSVKFKSFGIKNKHQADIRAKSLAELQPGIDVSLDRVCDRIIHNAPLYPMPSHEELQRSEDLEKCFLEQEEIYIHQLRHHIRDNSTNHNFSLEKPVRVIILESLDSPYDRKVDDWVHRSRHKNIVESQCQISDGCDSYQINIKKILEILENSSEEYILVTRSYWQYDESIIAYALRVFNDAKNPDLGGVMFGAWIVDGSNTSTIQDQIFTVKNPDLNYQNAVNKLPSIQDPSTLLSFVIFNKKYLIDLLVQLQQIDDVNLVSQTIFKNIQNASVYKTGLPLVLVPKINAVSNSKMQQVSINETQIKNELKASHKSMLSEYPLINVVIFWPSAGQFAPPVIVSKNEIFCDPDCQTVIEGNRIRRIKVPVDPFNISDVIDRLPLEQKPDLVIVHQDASKRGLPINLHKLNCPKILMLGDTHHLNAPIKTLLEYALQEKFDYITTEYNKQHLHYFQEAGFENTIWIPGFHAHFQDRPLFQSHDYSISFVGRVGRSHPYRQYILQKVKALDFPINILQASQTQASEIYSKSLINLNISLNGDLNQRIFEVLSSHGFLITDRLSPESGFNDLFQEGEHLVTFENELDLQQKLSYFIDHPEEVQEIAQKGHDLVWKNYNHVVNANRLIDYIQKGEIDPIYQTPKDTTYFKVPERPSLIKRITFYENLQEIHKQEISIALVFLNVNDIDRKMIRDLADLPRLKMYGIVTPKNKIYVDREFKEKSCTLVRPISPIELLQLRNSEESRIFCLNRKHLDLLTIEFFASVLKTTGIILSHWFELSDIQMQSLTLKFHECGFKQHQVYAQYWVKASEAILSQNSQLDTGCLQVHSFYQNIKKQPDNINNYIELGNFLASKEEVALANRTYAKAIELSL
ncbi:MAG: glycosyltransferase family protein [Kosmotogaceae bacterium]